MFAKTIIDSDAFLDMPLSTQCLYFHLNMRADDDGFVNNPRRVQRLIGASDDDLKLLIAKSFVLTFESGVIVIKHWRINNYIQKDRYHATVYKEEAEKLDVKDNRAYTFKALDTDCIQNGYKLDTEIRLDKTRQDKNSLDKSSLAKTIDEAPLVDGKDYTQTFWYFEDEFQRPLSQMECERILGYIKEYGEDETLDALRDASIEKKVKWPYIEAILRNRKKEAQA
jgi:DnaD/phage-associated family protein